MGRGSLTQEWGREGFPGKGLALSEEYKFEGTAPNVLGSGGRGTGRHVVLRDGPTLAFTPWEGLRAAVEGESVAAAT